MATRDRLILSYDEAVRRLGSSLQAYVLIFLLQHLRHHSRSDLHNIIDIKDNIE